MDKMKIMDSMAKYQESINELFKDVVAEDFYALWGDTFEIESVDDKQIVVAYDGMPDIKKFKKECKKTLVSCIYSVMGDGRKVKITKKSSADPVVSPEVKKHSVDTFTPELKKHSVDTFDAEIKKYSFDTFSPTTKKNIKAVNFFLIGMIFVCIATAVVVVLCSYIGNRDFRETFYITSSIKVDSRLRVVQLSDLHNASYGKNNKRLIDRVSALKPDIIICTGDMVNSAKEDADAVADLTEALAKIAPAYYIYGNNEVETIYDIPLNQAELDKKFGFSENNRDETALLKIKDSFEEKLEKTGIKVLKNEKDTINVKNMNVDVYGVLTSNPSSFWSYSEKAFADYINENPGNVKIMAAHEPVLFEEFNPASWGDLILCGHTHGGTVRIPVIGPLYTHEGGLLPERNGSFVYGRYNTAGSPLIVSAGLENSNVLRINNQPELVVVDVNKF